MRAEANIMNLEIPGELAYVYNKLDGKCFMVNLYTSSILEIIPNKF